MSRIICLLFAITFSLSQNIKSEEGMWLPFLLKDLNYSDMQEKGLKLSAEELYSINKACLKDAIVRLDGGMCTGEMISSKGLLLTNHHCGYEDIQSHSTVASNYLKTGFWAKSLKEELSNIGKTASFMISIEDVTKSVLKNVTDNLSEKQRDSIISSEIKNITTAITDSTHYEAVVEDYFEGNEFYLIVYETFKDIRLVGTPPESIGKYGGDTDNWMWPRHTGDFCLFRVYSDKDGKPAEYSIDNIPYKPKHHLPISIKGIKENDFAMTWGYPGSTDRYLSSGGISLAIEQVNSGIVKVRGEKLAILKKYMSEDDSINIMYSAKYNQISNYWKYFIGQTKGLKRLKVYEQKKKIEDDFQAWADADSVRKEKYGTVVKTINDNYNKLKEKKYKLASSYLREMLSNGCELILISYKSNQIATLDSSAISEYKDMTEKAFKNYNEEIDKELLKKLLTLYYNDIPENLHPNIYKKINKKYKGNISLFVDNMYEKSIFTTKEKLHEFLKKPKIKKIAKDPIYECTMSFLSMYWALDDAINKNSEGVDKAKRLFIAGLREMNPDKNYYPDANSTMRCSYGTVDDYFPADAIHYDYITTIEGVMEKEDPDNVEFIVEEKLKELYESKDYGQYAMENNKLPICFLSTNDITGGNSGSPVINSNGELIGLAFDGNWEAMSGDIAFEKELQRTISVDIRYVLFIIDKFAGATHLIDEMTLIK